MKQMPKVIPFPIPTAGGCGVMSLTLYAINTRDKVMVAAIVKCRDERKKKKNSLARRGLKEGGTCFYSHCCTTAVVGSSKGEQPRPSLQLVAISFSFMASTSDL